MNARSHVVFPGVSSPRVTETSLEAGVADYNNIRGKTAVHKEKRRQRVGAFLLFVREENANSATAKDDKR
jgi:hypothetical protein